MLFDHDKKEVWIYHAVFEVMKTMKKEEQTRTNQEFEQLCELKVDELLIKFKLINEESNRVSEHVLAEE